MVSITADTFIDLMHLADLADETAEQIIDTSVDLLNLYGQLDMSNMSGTAGAKTLNVMSQQKAAIMLVARAIYYSFYKGLSSASISGISLASTPDLLGNQVILDSVREAARLLREPDYSRAFVR
jgi:hypothetical protein